MRNLALTLAGAVAIAAPASAQTFDHRGFVVEGDNYNFQVGGRLHLDGVTVDDDLTLFDDEVDIRRLRIDATLTLFDDFRVKVDGDVAGISTGFRNVWAEYSGFGDLKIKGGNFIAPVLGENLKSSNDLKFLERSAPASLAPGFLLGGGVTYDGGDVIVSAGYFRNALSTDDVAPDDDGQSFAGRISWSPVRERGRTVFVAAGVERRKLDQNALSEVQAIPEFGLDFTNLIDTGNLDGVESYVNISGEAGASFGPVSLQGHFITRINDAPALGDPNFWGASAEAAWVLTGERQRYSRSSATFGEVRPRSRFGALEVAARYSRLDLTDELVAGGVQDSITLGVNWYLTRNVKLSGNWVRAKADPNDGGFQETASAFAGRLQIAF